MKKDEKNIDNDKYEFLPKPKVDNPEGIKLKKHCIADKNNEREEKSHVGEIGSSDRAEISDEEGNSLQIGRFLFIVTGMILTGVCIFYIVVLHGRGLGEEQGGDLIYSSEIERLEENSSGISDNIKAPAEKVDLGVMGTIITQKIYAVDSDEIAGEISEFIKEFEKKISAYDEDSEIYNLNFLAGIEKTSLSDDVFDLLTHAKEFSIISNGLFDITIGPLTSAWNISSENDEILKSSDVKALMELIGYDKLVLSSEDKSAFLKSEEMSLDLGGIAKGYVCDLVREKYKEKDVYGALITLGGDIAAFGEKPDGTDFVIGIQDPRGEEGEIFASLELSDKVISTTGDYEKFFEKDGKRYHHILDTETGYPAETDLISVSVISEDGIIADFLSTSIFIEGKEAVLSRLNQNSYSIIAVDKEKNVYVSNNIKDEFNFKGGEAGYIYVE